VSIATRQSAVLFLAALVAAQTQIGPDELTLRAAPYWPLAAAATIRTQVELVEVPVVVRDRNGAAVGGLTRDDFEIFDSGRKQEITAFSVETFPRSGAAAPSPNRSSTAAAPARPDTLRRFIALVLDDLNSDFGSLRRGQNAAEQFVAGSLSPGDEVAVFTTALSETVTFTNDRRKLETVIEKVRPHARSSDDRTCPQIRPYEAYAISNDLDRDVLDARIAELMGCVRGISRSAAEQAVRMKARGIWEIAKANTGYTLRSIASIVSTMSQMPGRRAVLLASSGFITGEEEQSLQAITTMALHTGVIINALDLRGLYPIMPGGQVDNPRPGGMTEMAIQGRAENAKDDGIAVLASGTGGQFFHNNNDLAAGFHRLGALPEVLYVLGFDAGSVAHDGRYHPLKVRLKAGRRGAVQSRMGYTAPPKELPADMARQQQTDTLLTGDKTLADIAARVTAEPESSASGPKVAVKTWIDIARLQFATREDRRTQKLTVIAGLLDGAGNFVTGREAKADAALTEAGYASLARVGLTIALSLHAPPGKYRLRVLVREELTGKMSATGRAVELR